ncbi:TRAP transporter small permease subunit [Clostridium sp. MCC353]|uniref:TRAP transporter small permease n=1 Tax=Clostridium sp. MCC353 TaxID=2592646 RepID=UPI001C01CECD|nr:TRAP transporter small permease [Clostridium sp. MCC353]MBT9774938.1 TRAP transporter small permease subunit [Clostridium sp. MCC353]
MEKVEKFVIDVILTSLLKVIGSALVLDILLQIAARYLPIRVTWTDEIGRLLFVWFAMLSTAMAYAKNQHLCIDYIYLKFNKKVQKLLDYFSIILVLATSSVLFYTGIQVMKIVAAQKSPILKISMSYFYASVPVGFAFILIFNIVTLIDKLIIQKK